MITNHRKYRYSFAELLDRASIVNLKTVYAKEGKEKFEEEMGNILHDIQLEIDEGITVTSEVIHALIVLSQCNLEIWSNEDFARSNVETSATDTAKALTYTHRLNGTRCNAKSRIQNLIGGRVDPKINCLAEGSAWEINW